MNNDLIYGYLTESDREFEAEMLKIDLETQRYQTAYEMVDRQLQENFKFAELKVLEENGTYADLNYLYTEATKDAEEKKKGIFSTIIKAIKDFFTNIFNRLRGVKAPSDENATADVPEGFDFNKVSQNLGALDANVNSLISAIERCSLPHMLTFAATVIGSLGTIYNGIGLVKKNKEDVHDSVQKMKKVPANQIEKIKNQFEKVAGALRNIKDTFEGKDTPDGDKEEEYKDENGEVHKGTFSKMMGGIRRIVSTISNFICGIFGKKKDAGAPDQTGAPESNTSTTPTNNETNTSTEPTNNNGEPETTTKPKPKTPKSKTPKSKTPKPKTPKSKTPKSKTPKPKTTKTKTTKTNTDDNPEDKPDNETKPVVSSAQDELFRSIFGYDYMTEQALQEEDEERELVESISHILDEL